MGQGLQHGDRELDMHGRAIGSGEMSESVVRSSEVSFTLRWSSSSAPPLACRAGAPPAGYGTKVGGGWNAFALGIPLSKPEK